MVHHFLHTNPYIFRDCTHILTRTKGKKFEDMFLVKIANKGTSLVGDYCLIKFLNRPEVLLPSQAHFVMCLAERGFISKGNSC